MTDVYICNLWKKYGQQVVLERINLKIDHHSFCTIVGASGCGKTTFLRLLLGQDQPSRGGIFVDGIALPTEPGPERGIVFQRYSVFPHQTVLENVMLGLEFEQSRFAGRLYGQRRKLAVTRADEALDAVGLLESRDKYPSSLSGGMQQRLAIAQSLIKQPSILLLDEPFGALDPGIRADMHALIKSLWRQYEMTVFMITHDLKEAFDLGTRLLVLDRQRRDPHDPTAYGATVTYDIPIDRDGRENACKIAAMQAQGEVAVSEEWPLYNRDHASC